MVVPVDIGPDQVAVRLPSVLDDRVPLDPPELQLLPWLPPTAPSAPAEEARASPASLPWSSRSITVNPIKCA